VTWDDHEVFNDYADDRSELLHPLEWFLHRRAAAYRAYYEHMPLRRNMVPLGSHSRLCDPVISRRAIRSQLYRRPPRRSARR